MQSATEVPMQRANQGRVVRGTAAYLLTSTVQRGVSFVLLPVFALVLSPSEFGQIGIIGTIAGGVAALLGLGLETSVFRTLVQLRGRPVETRRFLNTVGLFATVAPVLAAGLLAFPVGLLVERLYDIPAAWVALGVIGSGLSVGVTSVCFASLRAEERLRQYVLLGAAQVVLRTGLPLWLIIFQGAGVAGWFGGTALGSALLLPIGLVAISHRFSLDFDRRYLYAALVFGIPMVPHALSQWGLALSDRVVLGMLVSNAELGVYHVAYQFGLPISILAAALAQSVQPIYAEAAIDRHSSTSDLRRVATYQALAVAFAGATVALLGGPALRLLLPESYGAAAGLIPWIALGTTFFGLYFIPMNVIVLLAGRNRWVWTITLGAALANIVLNFALVPVVGIVAAAFNTAVGYGVLLAGVAWYSDRVADPGPGYEWRRMLAGFGLVGATLILLAFGSSSVWIDVVVRLAALGLLAFSLFAMRLLPPTLLRFARMAG